MSETMITGKDVRVSLSIDGVAAGECDATEFTVRTNTTKIEARAIGCPGTKMVDEFESYSGTLTFVVTDGSLDAFEDAYIEAISLGRLPNVRITETKNYVDNTSKTYTYRGVRLDFETRSSRGEAVQTTINWMSGQVRAPALNLNNFVN